LRNDSQVRSSHADQSKAFLDERKRTGRTPSTIDWRGNQVSGIEAIVRQDKSFKGDSFEWSKRRLHASISNLNRAASSVHRPDCREGGQ
jgi:hypothetical protein